MHRFKVASVFSNHMVLQRDREICIFGEGENGESVTVSLYREDGELVRRGEGEIQNNRFEIYLTSEKAGGPYRIEVSCNGENKVFTDVLFGDVYLAGGQSNMEYELGNCLEGPEVLSRSSFPNVRFYYTQKKGLINDDFLASEEATCWQVGGDEWMKAWSAVGFFFAEKLAGVLEVPIGIIGCNWGGTSVSTWIDKEKLEEDAELSSYVEEYKKACKDKTVEEQIKEYEDYVVYHTAWDQGSAKLYQERPGITWDEVQEILGPCQYPGPMNCANPFRPAGLYECMLMRVCPYTLKGVIWYQGESDDHKPYMYEKLFTKMIRAWREYFHDLSLPFLFVQLPMHKYTADTDYLNWPVIREAQETVYKTVKNTGMAVISDYSDFNEIHPHHKKVVGERLADQALIHIYGKNAKEGPLYDYTENPCDGSLIVHLRNAEGGMCVHEAPSASEGVRSQGGILIENPVPNRIRGFEIAGIDQVYYTAEASILSDDTIKVFSQKVKKPIYVRYAWTNYMDVNLFGKMTDIPLPTFRSSRNDHAPESLGCAAIQQIMEI